MSKRCHIILDGRVVGSVWAIECPQCHSCHFVPDDGQTVCSDCDDTNSYELAMETRGDY